MASACDPPAGTVTSTTSLRGWYGAVFLALAMLVVAPIWVVENPPLVDYPNHLARGYILHHLDDLPVYRERLEISYLSTPSLAMDASMAALQPVCDVRIAGKLFLTATLLLWLAGWHLLGYAIHGRPTWFALGGSLVAYHSMFFYGFTNFSFSLGVYLVSLAAWLHGRSRWRWPRHVLMAALALACFYSHLSAFIFLVGSALAVTAWEVLRDRTITRAAIIDLLPFFVPLVCVRGGGQTDISWNFPAKLIGATSLFRGYHLYLDIAVMLATALLVFLLFFWAIRVRAVGSVLFVGIGCLGMFLVGPYFLFGGAPADARFLLPAGPLIFLSVDVAWPRWKAMALLGGFLALVVFRIAVIGYTWHALDADLSEQVALLKELPKGASVYPIVKLAESSDAGKRSRPAFHAVCYSVIDRHAFVPSLLAIPGHIPMRYKTPPVYFHADAEHFAPLDDVAWDKVFADYDYLWCYALPDDYRQFLVQRCELVSAKGKGTLWRVPKSLR